MSVLNQGQNRHRQNRHYTYILVVPIQRTEITLVRNPSHLKKKKMRVWHNMVKNSELLNHTECSRVLETPNSSTAGTVIKNKKYPDTSIEPYSPKAISRLHD